MRVAVIQMNSTQSVEANLAQARELLEQAKRDQAELAVLPENFACYGSVNPKAIALAEVSGGPITGFLANASKELDMWIVAGTVPLLSHNSHELDQSHGNPSDLSTLPYAACTLWSPQGRCVTQYNQCHLFDVDVADAVGSYRESDSYKCGNETQEVSLNHYRLGLSVCYDLRFPEFFRKMAGVDVIALPSAFTHATGKAHWEVLIRARAIENQCYMLAANQVGEHSPGRFTWGQSAIVDPWGDIIAEVTASAPGTAVADLNLDYIKALRAKMPCLQHRKF